MQSRKRVFLGLGSNVGDRLESILNALRELSRLGEVRKVSTVYESKPWGVEEQPPFLNCVVEFWTYAEPPVLLSQVKDIERRLGRKRRKRWGPREIDIDILLYGSTVIESEELRIPHPFIAERDFVLIPLMELDESLTDPRTGTPYAKSLERIEEGLTPFCSVLSELLPLT